MLNVKKTLKNFKKNHIRLMKYASLRKQKLLIVY